MPQLPPINIKGLGSAVAAARQGLSDVRATIAEVNVETAGLKQDLEDVKEQIINHRRDLRFEAEVVGNGGERLSEAEKAGLSAVDKVTAPVSDVGTSDALDTRTAMNGGAR